jgi:hypothetical protein
MQLLENADETPKDEQKPKVKRTRSKAKKSSSEAPEGVGAVQVVCGTDEANL